jgi:DNA-binding response OmpR family regulator
MMSPASVTVRVFLVEREPLISGWISDVLAERGVQVRVLPKVVDVMRAARSAEPHAVIVDLASIAEAHEAHLRMGPDHVMSVLRQTYPQLCIVALVSTYNAQMEALSQEFRVPLLIKPFGSAQLLSVLEQCRVIAATHNLSH